MHMRMQSFIFSIRKKSCGFKGSKDEVKIEPPPPKLKNLVEAVRNQESLDSKRCISEATSIACVVDKVGILKFRVSHQSSSYSYLLISYPL